MRKLGLVLLFVVCCFSTTPILLQAAIPISPSLQLQPFVTPLPTHTPRSLFPSPSPQATAVPAFQLNTPQSGTLPPSATPVPTLAPSATPNPALGHLLLGRPILDVGNGTVARTYPYGGTNGGRLQVHHGVDLVNPIGTPIHAAGDGTVIYAGDDLTHLFAPITDYYGRLVIIQHEFLSAQGLPVYTLYGHMEQITARAGQFVREGDIIGVVGATGIALGPHLHFEVRVGKPFDFDATRNPEMWMRPYPGFGVLAGRVTDADGNPAYSAALVVTSSLNEWRSYTYGDDSVNPDSSYGENYAVGDLPAGSYIITVIQGGRVRAEQTVTVLPDQMTWLDISLLP